MKHSNHRLKTPEPIKSSRQLQYYGEFELFSFVFVKPQAIVKTNYYFQNETHPATKLGRLIFLPNFGLNVKNRYSRLIEVLCKKD